ncbi:50S ribosomal protein L31e [Candidatus Nanohalococcus occultus]|uniref:Large ribosomal subunit protein eL31 n=2 Tax=Candidatus Nanohalococcus occultus TaxID=2978047 RepID=A0ABY8CDX0_9ARCH|nr:Ribosomal protein L31E [Candidatus Nanohaloarchaeota archaeon SVXNc]
MNISQAYAYPRNKRASKALAVLRRKLETKEGEIKVSNELNNVIWKRGVQKPPKRIDVVVEENDDGEKVAYPEE